MEVVWTRQFVPFLGPVVYSFACMLAVYLAATAAGSRIYRGWVQRAPIHRASLAVLAGCCALLPLAAADPRLHTAGLLMGALRMALGVGGFCGVLGFLTPMLVDRWSAGDPDRAGRAYAVNAAGCILGPLLSGFVLLPWVGERWTLVLLAIPFFLFGLRSNQRLMAAALFASLALVMLTQDFERRYPGAIVRRDHTATVIAAGEGMQKQLLVNGIGMTNLTPITKMMAHLPLASLDHPPRKVLVVCFGMGTSYRSALSWGLDATAVDLVPSVPGLFGFFHADGDHLLNSPRGTIMIDDGRRFLERTRELFDAIIIDPPPPVEAAASSLLYSVEFYQVAARRLRPGGLLQQWIPGAERSTISAVAQALGRTFAEVRVFPSVEGWGEHFLTSNRPMHRYTAAQLAARVPPAAARDMLEWGPATSLESQFEKMLSGEMPLRKLIDADPSAPVLTDDRPVNEYYFLRRLAHGPEYFEP
jgi:predicted membrane-bound spermidine synthase